jgi:hypothetical protein
MMNNMESKRESRDTYLCGSAMCIRLGVFKRVGYTDPPTITDYNRKPITANQFGSQLLKIANRLKRLQLAVLGVGNGGYNR